MTEPESGLFRSEVYALPDPAAFAGAWQAERPLAELAPAQLELRNGCAVLLRRTGDGAYAGSTVARECTSGLRGASYATSEVEIQAGRITSWDRGFDAEGVQVWGAEKGPYVFLRLDPAAGN